MQTVVIAGTGLIGASLGLALRRAGFAGRILGVSSDGALRDALARGAIDSGATLEDAAPEGDLIVLAQPILRILELLPRLAPLIRPEALVTDVGSTKRAIMAAAGASIQTGIFVGGHPMAGKEVRGAGAADADLFRGRPWFLTPRRPEDLMAESVVELGRWLEAIGAQRVVVTPTEHDAIVAATSHLPQMLSTALAAVLGRQENAERLAVLGGPGLADTTRLAMSSYEIWRDILNTNADAIEPVLVLLEREIAQVRRNLRDPSLEDTFSEAAKFARAVRESRL